MRGVFGILGLLIVVAIIGLVARKQLQAVSSSPVGGVSAASGPAANVPPQQVPQQVKQDVERALQQGAAARASEADQ